jgi:hypothetical protein
MGIEHGIGEVLQGNVAPDGIVIASWPESEWFDILAGEPAMTLVPNLLVAGMLSILVAGVLIVWATMFVQRKNGGLILMGLSIVLLLVGGGFGPPMLGILLGGTATRIPRPLPWGGRLSPGARRSLGRLWRGSFIASGVAWLLLFPGAILLDHFIGVSDPELIVPLFFFSAMGGLLLTIVTGLFYDGQGEREADPGAARLRGQPASHA